jgi:hypothetical protein
LVLMPMRNGLLHLSCATFRCISVCMATGKAD